MMKKIICTKIPKIHFVKLTQVSNFTNFYCYENKFIAGICPVINHYIHCVDKILSQTND